MPAIARLDDTKYGNSTFVTDCGVPSAFEKAFECQTCTMCCEYYILMLMLVIRITFTCPNANASASHQLPSLSPRAIGNANDDCYPQVKTFAEKWGLKNYGIVFAAVLLAVFIILCCVVSLFVYRFRKSTMSRESSDEDEEDDTHALRKIGKDSVYSYIVTNKPLGWLAAVITLDIQVGILGFFIFASEANLQDDKIDIEFTWKCPRDSEARDNKVDLTKRGWAIFSVLMIAFLAKDFINGSKLLYHSSKSRHSGWKRFRCFIGGMGLFSITAFALYVSSCCCSCCCNCNVVYL